MKKIVGVGAVLIVFLLVLIYRQLVSCHTRQHMQEPSIPIAVIEESIVLGSLLIQEDKKAYQACYDHQRL